MGKISIIFFEAIDFLEPYFKNIKEAFRLVVKGGKKTWKFDCIVFALICLVIFTKKSIFYHYEETNFTVGQSLALAFREMIYLVRKFIVGIIAIIIISGILSGILTTIVAKWADKKHIKYIEYKRETKKEEDNKENEKMIGKISSPSLAPRTRNEHPELKIDEELLKSFFEDDFNKNWFGKFIEKLKSVEEKYCPRDYGKLAAMMTCSSASKEVLLNRYNKLYGNEKSINFGKFIIDFYAAIGIKCSSTDKSYYEEAVEKVKEDFEDILNYKVKVEK